MIDVGMLLAIVMAGCVGYVVGYLVGARDTEIELGVVRGEDVKPCYGKAEQRAAKYNFVTGDESDD